MKFLFLLTTLLMLTGTQLSARQQDPDQDDDSRAQRAFATLSVSLGGSGYNRIEGLPFWIGPVGRTAGPNPFRGRAVLILRSDPAVNLDQVGYRVQGEKVLQRKFLVGVSGYSEVVPIEDRGLSNIDNSLSTFIFHDDYRDYYNRQGVSAYAAYAPVRGSVSAFVELRTERHDVLGRSNPQSLFRNNSAWRFQPLVAEGKVHSASLGAQFDNRPRRTTGRRPGWFVQAGIMQALGGNDLVFPEVRRSATDPPLTGIPTIDPSFSIGTLDLRRYNAFANLNLNLRFVASGALSNEVLPPQFQHALGGRGSLPGLNTLAERLGAPPAMDCGARTAVLVSTDLEIGSPRLYSFYGCDRYVLFQVQLEGYFGFRIGPEDLGLRGGPTNLRFELVPRWIAFFDAAQAWALGPLGVFPRSDESRKYDAGGGIAFGDLGFFVAVPLQGGDRDPRLVVRLGSRF